MPEGLNQSLLEGILDSWNRNNTILINLLGAFSQGELEGFALEAKVMEGSPSIAVMFSHIHKTRYFWLSNTAPEFAENLSDLFEQQGEQRIAERDPQRIEQALNQSAKAIAEAVRYALETGRELKGENVAYDHPILLLQHMLWHEGYHVGQMMLALKALGHQMADQSAESAIWSVWRLEW
jgi:uncharacterized damage-inducible protein DinB